MKPKFITFSGIDDTVSERDWLEHIAYFKDHDLLDKMEFGILYMPEKRNRAKYPDFRWIADFIEKCRSSGVKVALHLCGREAFLPFLDGRDSQFFSEFASVSRFQLNLNARQEEFNNSQVRDILGSMWDSNRTYILQMHERSKEQIQKALQAIALVDPAGLRKVQILHDSSKGTDQTPNSWPNFFEDKIVQFRDYDEKVLWGYAGGLGPDNIRSELDRIIQSRTYHPDAHLTEIKPVVTPCDYWVDMESNIRSPSLSSTRFDLGKVKTVMDHVYL